MKHPEFMRFVINTFNKYRLHLIVNDDELVENGIIYYMNGNDGTDFDYIANHRLCEFCSFYKHDNMGYMILCINDDDTALIYMYEKNQYNPSIQEVIKFPYKASTFAKQMYSIADCQEKFDVSIYELDWDKEYVLRKWS